MDDGVIFGWGKKNQPSGSSNVLGNIGHGKTGYLLADSERQKIVDILNRFYSGDYKNTEPAKSKKYEHISADNILKYHVTDVYQLRKSGISVNLYNNYMAANDLLITSCLLSEHSQKQYNNEVKKRIWSVYLRNGELGFDYCKYSEMSFKSGGLESGINNNLNHQTDILAGWICNNPEILDANRQNSVHDLLGDNNNKVKTPENATLFKYFEGAGYAYRYRETPTRGGNDYSGDYTYSAYVSPNDKYNHEINDDGVENSYEHENGTNINARMLTSALYFNKNKGFTNDEIITSKVNIYPHSVRRYSHQGIDIESNKGDLYGLFHIYLGNFNDYANDAAPQVKPTERTIDIYEYAHSQYGPFNKKTTTIYAYSTVTHYHDWLDKLGKPEHFVFFASDHHYDRTNQVTNTDLYHTYYPDVDGTVKKEFNYLPYKVGQYDYYPGAQL